MSFSQRIGKTPLAKNIQIDSIDDDLKNGLWNIFNMFILDSIKTEHDYEFNIVPTEVFSNSIWHHHFKKPIDTIPNPFYYVRSEIRAYFFKCDWYKLYDLIEFTVELLDHRYYKISIDQDKVIDYFNGILERENSGYRFIDKKLVPITNTTEIGEIEESLVTTESFTPLNGCNIHLKAALSKLSDRQNPDYRNSIKESVSAVESLVKIISNNSKDSLGASLDKIKGKLKLHQSLEKGFKHIYGYTSDSDGIRHAMTEESTCEFEDAKFMLVSCSAFINYLIVKAGKAEIKF